MSTKTEIKITSSHFEGKGKPEIYLSVTFLEPMDPILVAAIDEKIQACSAEVLQMIEEGKS